MKRLAHRLAVILAPVAPSGGGRPGPDPVRFASSMKVVEGARGGQHHAPADLTIQTVGPAVVTDGSTTRQSPSLVP